VLELLSNSNIAKTPFMIRFEMYFNFDVS